MRQFATFIAIRYLFAKKSHNVINVISAISAVGMAVGAAALITILSVYNGFDALVKKMISGVEPDLAIVPSEGKFFTPEGPAYDWAYDNKAISSMCNILKDNVFVSYEGNQGTALLLGVDDIWCEESRIAGKVVGGEFSLHRGEIPLAAVGASFARTMGINHHFLSPIELYYPDASTRFNPANPTASLRSDNLWPSCEVEISSDMDNTLIISDIDIARELLGRDGGEVSQVQIRLREGCGKKEAAQIKEQLSSLLGDGFRVLDRVQQNPSLYRMLRYEKAGVYLIMVFVCLILGFSIFGSMTMLIIDKKEDIATLRALGAPGKTVRRCFTIQGWMITLLGAAAGLAAGIVICLLQERLGVVKMPGNFIVDAYPIDLQWLDVAICATSIALIGYLIALAASRRIKLQNEYGEKAFPA